MPLTAETHPLSGKTVLVACVVSGVFSGLSAVETSIILASWKPSTIKQYQHCWKRWTIWCHKWKVHLFRPSEIDIVKFVTFLVQNKYSYSVVNTYRSMFTQTLQYFNVQWVKNPLLLSRFMQVYIRGMFQKKSLKIPKGQSETLYRRRTDNKMAKRKSTNNNRQNIHIKLEIG